MPDASEPLQLELATLGVTAVAVSDPDHAAEVDLIAIEPKRLGQNVAELRCSLEQTHPGVPVVVIGDAGLESAIEAMRAGAADYLETTAPAAEIAAAARRLISERAIASSLSGRQEAGQGLELTGNSPKLRELRERVAQLAASDVTVLISGETGAGKELVANLLHGKRAGNHGPFVVVSCSTIPASLAES